MSPLVVFALILMGVMTNRVVATALLLSVALTTPALAQPQTPTAPASTEDRLSLTFNAGTTQMSSPNFDAPVLGGFNAPVLGGSVQFALKKWLVLEGEIGRWSGTIHYESANTTRGSGAVLVRVARGVFDHDFVAWNAGANLLFRTTGQRWKVFGGIGGGAVWEEEVYSFARSGCVPANPTVCRSGQTRLEARAEPAVDSLAGIEVRILPRVWVFGMAREEGRVAEAISGDKGQSLRRMVAGVRFVAR